VEFGIQTGQQHRSYREILNLWQIAERLGFTYAWLYDHLVPVGGDLDGDVFEAWTMLASLLSRTEHIRGGILVTCVMYRRRRPREGGDHRRSRLGRPCRARPSARAGTVGSGLYGIDFPPLRERNERLPKRSK